MSVPNEQAHHRTNEQSLTVPDSTTAAPAPTTSRPSACDTLGLVALTQCNNHHASRQSLALGLDTYLNDLQEGTDPLAYWQVLINLLHSI